MEFEQDLNRYITIIIYFLNSMYNKTDLNINKL